MGCCELIVPAKIVVYAGCTVENLLLLFRTITVYDCCIYQSDKRSATLKMTIYFHIRLKQVIFAQMKPKQKLTAAVRTKQANFSLSDEEYNLICLYMKKYKISNKSRWLRETVMAHVLKNLELDYPTLFGENEMRR